MKNEGELKNPATTKRLQKYANKIIPSTTVDSTSTHRTIFWSALWVLALSGCVIGFFYHAVQILDFFAAAHILTTRNFLYENDSFPFPTVVLCNALPVSVSNTRMYDYKNAEWQDQITPGFENILNLYGLYKSTFQLLQDNQSRISFEDLENPSGLFNFKLENAFRDWLDFQTFGNLSISKDMFIVDCVFSTGVDCNYTLFKEVYNPKYSKCFLLDWSKMHSNNVNLSSEMLSLTVTLFIDAYPKLENYMMDKNQSDPWKNESPFRLLTPGAVEMQLVVPGEYPHPLRFVSTSAGFHRIMEVQHTAYKRLNKKKRPCYMSKNKTVQYFDVLSQKYESFLYSRDDCVMELAAQAYLKECKCLPMILPRNRKFDGNVKQCYHLSRNITEEQVDECHHNEKLFHCQQLLREIKDIYTSHACVKRIRQRYAHFAKRCPVPCDENVYKVQSYMKTWPGDEYSFFYHWYRTLGKQPEDLDSRPGQHWAYHQILKSDSNADRKAVSHNMVQITVQVDELEPSYEHTEEWAYPLSNLLSDMGGILGLWLGLSFLSIVEFVELASQLQKKLWLRRQKKSAPRSLS